MTSPRILIAGIGNIFLGDDAFGVEVVQRLAARPLPEGVRAVDFGIRSFDLACAMIEGYDAVVLVDLAPRGGPPGTLYVIEPEIESSGTSEFEPVEGHAMNPARLLQWVRGWGGAVPPLRLVGCEPAIFGTDDDPQLGLSPPVARAVEGALELIQSLIEEFSPNGTHTANPA